MCFGAWYEYTHAERNTDTNDTIHTFLSWSYNPPYPEKYAGLTRIFTIQGKNRGTLVYLVFLVFLGLDLHAYFYLHLGEGHFLLNQVLDHIISLCSSEHKTLYFPGCGCGSLPFYLMKLSTL